MSLLVAVAVAVGCFAIVAAIAAARGGEGAGPVDRRVSGLEASVLGASSASEVLDRVVGGCREIFGATRAVVFRLDESAWRAIGPDADGEVPGSMATPMAWFAHNPEVVIASELERARFGAIGPALEELFARFDIDAALPLVDRRLVVAVIGLKLPPLLAAERDALEELRGFSGAACANLRLHAEAAHAVNLDREASDLTGLAMALSPEPPAGTLELCTYASYGRIAGDVGSDFALVEPRDSELWVVVGDAVGAGLPAALIAAAIKGAIDATLSGGRCDPESLLAFAHLPLDRPDGRARASCVAARIEAGTIEWSSAGHVNPYLVRGERVEALAAPGPLLGSPGTPRRNRAGLEPGDRLVFLTNGVIDAIGEGDDQRGHRRVQRLLARSGVAASEICDRLAGAIAARRPDPRDDETVVVVAMR